MLSGGFLPAQSPYQLIDVQLTFHTMQTRATYHLTLVMFGNALQRIAIGTSGVLVGLYLADLANHGAAVSAALVGPLVPISFCAQLIGPVPMGIASSAVPPQPFITP